jgi:predicted TIM-barrel fold metal-dependent hydrolase
VNALPSGATAFLDFARANDSQALRQLVNRVSADRIVYGSAAPLMETARSTDALQQANLKAEQVNTIRGGNAKGLMGSSN